MKTKTLFAAMTFFVALCTTPQASAQGPIFAPPIEYGSGGYTAESVAGADVNGDGKPDLVVANECADSNCANGGTVSVLLGNGDGTFQTAVSYGSGGSEGLAAESLAVADVNGDGKPDVIVANNCSNGCSNGTVGVLLGNGDGTFQTAASYTVTGSAASVAVADVNGDGKLDLLVENWTLLPGSDTVSVLLGNGDGTFRSAVTYVSGAGTDIGGFWASLVVRDVNGDGKPDLVVANTCADSNCANGSVGVLLGNGDGTFQAPVAYSSGGYEALSVAVADVNGDGKLDVLVTNECDMSSGCANGSVGVLLGNGNGTFKAASVYVAGIGL